MNVVASPRTLVSEVYGILGQARREMRSEKYLSVGERQRIESRLTLAQFQLDLRDAARQQRRGRRPSPYRYRMELT